MTPEEQAMMEQQAMQPPMDEGMEPPMEEPTGLMEEVDDEMLEELSDGISDYIHGDAREHISTQIAQSKEELGEVIGAIAYQIMSDVSMQVAEMSPEMVSFDVLIPIAQDTIDYLVEIAVAVGAPVNDEDQVRVQSFMVMLDLHKAKVGDDPEQLAMIEELIMELMGDEATMNEVDSYVNEKIKAEGGDPSQVEKMSEQMFQQIAQPKQDPLAQGVQQGLMQQ